MGIQLIGCVFLPERWTIPACEACRASAAARACGDAVDAGGTGGGTRRLCGRRARSRAHSPRRRDAPRAHHHPHGTPGVELHWRVHYYEGRFAEAALRRAHRLVHGYGRRLRREDELACLLLSYARDGFAGPRLASDLAAWWDRHGARLALRPEGVLHSTLRYRPELRRAIVTAARVTERVVGVPAAAIVLRGRVGVSLRAAAGESAAHGQRGADRRRGFAARPAAGPARGLPGFVRRQLVPSIEFVVMHDQLAADATPLERWLSRAGHTVRVLRRYAIALLRVVGHRAARRREDAEASGGYEAARAFHGGGGQLTARPRHSSYSSSSRRRTNGRTSAAMLTATPTAPRRSRAS